MFQVYIHSMLRYYVLVFIYVFSLFYMGDELVTVHRNQDIGDV